MLMGDSKLTVGANVSVNGCLFCCLSPATDNPGFFSNPLFALWQLG